MKESRPKHGGSFLDRGMYLSDACLGLSRNGWKALMAVMDQRQFKKVKGRKKPVCVNADNLKLPYGLLQKTFGIPCGRIPQALDELLAKGFIRLVYAGGAHKHDMSQYALSENWRWWKRGTVFQTRPTRQHHGYQGKLLGAIARKNLKRANIAHETEGIHTHETEGLKVA
jgi:hypothetical protein